MKLIDFIEENFALLGLNKTGIGGWGLGLDGWMDGWVGGWII